MNVKFLAVALASLACASCASPGLLRPLSIQQVPTAKGHVNKWTTRVNVGVLAGDLMVSDFYYQARPQPVTPALLREMDIRARIAGCSGGAEPRRTNVSARWSTYGTSYRIISWYSCH